MTNNLQSILDELYAIDPSLRDHETELIPVIEVMMRSKPDVTPDPAFALHLRMTLRDKAHSHRHFPFSIFNFQFFTMNHLQYTLSGLLIGIIVAAPLTYSLTKSGESSFATPESDSTQKLFSYSIEETGSNAFGDISIPSGTGWAPMNAPVAPGAMMARPEAGAVGIPVVGDRPVEPPTYGESRDGTVQNGGVIPIGMPYPIDKMMIDPELTEYRLTFNGELPALSGNVDVFKRLKGTASADISKILGAFNTGLIDLRSFAGAKTDMITFYQETKYGLIGTVSFREGSISLSQNWEQWPHPESMCQDEACSQRYRLRESDIPTDSVLMSIAQKFVEDHDIDLSQYAAPEVNREWKAQYEMGSDPSMVWIPDSVRVMYPLLVDGKPVYEESGLKVGIGIGVNVREKKVSDASGIMDQKYQKSSYAGVTDEAVIRGYLSNYGKVDSSWMPPNTTRKTVNIALGPPVLSLVRMYTYANNIGEEVLVPALVFPVTNVSDGSYFYNESIVVPLASDVLKEWTSRGNSAPMPLMMEDAERAEVQE